MSPQDPFLAVAFYSMLGISAITLLYPWSLRKRASRILVHLPLLIGAIYVPYDKAMRDAEYFRVDLPLLRPTFLLVGVVYAFKLLFLGISAWQRKHSTPWNGRAEGES